MNILKRAFLAVAPRPQATTALTASDGARFSPGLCNELIALQKAHPSAVFSEKFRFGLKQLGTLYVFDWIARHKPRRVLEMGAGLSLYFDQAIGQHCDYWMVDDSGFYDAKAFADADAKRKNTTFASGLVGQKIDDLPANHFDLIFSISVLEHAPNNAIQPISDHMRQLLAPGGRIIHSLDLPIRLAPARAERWHRALVKSGFDVPDPKPWLRSDALINSSALMEPMHIVHEYYGRSSGADAVAQHEWHNTTFMIDAGA